MAKFPAWLGFEINCAFNLLEFGDTGNNATFPAISPLLPPESSVLLKLEGDECAMSGTKRQHI
jgi:hypothetical protein